MRPALLWRATRAYSLPASVVPVALGTVLATRGYGADDGGHFSAWIFLVTLVGAVLAHFGANVLNDYFDFVKGVDTRPEHGSGVLTGGMMTPQAALAFASTLLAGAGICALFLVRHNHQLIVITAIGLACAVLYPTFLKKYGLGDLLIVIAFGIGLTAGAYGVQTGPKPWRDLAWVAFYSLPVCLLVDAILHANNLRDAADDRAAHVRTLATLLSPRAGEMWQLCLLFGPLLFVVVGVVTRLLPAWSLATLLSVPFLIRAARSGSVPGTAQTHLIFGLLYTLSLLLPPAYI